MKLTLRLKGGPGSGHHGHSGRPGKRGGSLPGAGGGMVYGSMELINKPDIVDHGDDTYDVKLFVSGEGHSEDALADLVNDVLSDRYPAGASTGYIVDIFDVYEVDDTTSVTAGAERV